MPLDRPAGLPRAPAGAAAVLALVLAATLLDGGGLLLPAADPSASAAALLRGGGLAVAVGALAALLRHRGVGLRGAPSVLATAGAVAGTVALLTLPVSPVRLDWPPPDDPDPLPPTEAAPSDPTADPATAAAPPPPVVRLPAGGQLQVQGDVLYLELPDGSTYDLGTTGGDAAALPPAPLLQLEVQPGGELGMTDGAGGALGAVPDGGGLDLGDVRIEGAGGNPLVDVTDGAVTDAGGATSGEVQLVPEPSEPDQQDVAATVAGVLLAVAAYYLVFLHGRTVPRRARATDVEGDPLPAEAPPPGDAAAAGAGLVATLEGLLADPDPRTAIVAAYARLLAALDDAGVGRQPQEAPHEHLRRALQPLGVHPAPVHDLAELFVLARFSEAPVTEAHRDAAIDALRRAVDDLALVPA